MPVVLGADWPGVHETVVHGTTTVPAALQYLMDRSELVASELYAMVDDGDGRSRGWWQLMTSTPGQYNVLIENSV